MRRPQRITSVLIVLVSTASCLQLHRKLNHGIMIPSARLAAPATGNKARQSIRLFSEMASVSDMVSMADTSFIDSIILSPDPTKYWFMFPISVSVAFCALTSGIGGAALYGPIFLILFPLLGPQYPLQSSAAAIGTAILVETFGFSSGLLGYYRRKLIDYDLAIRLCAFSIPSAILASEYLHIQEYLLKWAYSILMIALGVSLYQSSKNSSDITSESVLTGNPSDQIDQSSLKTLINSEGEEIAYPNPSLSITSYLSMAVGGVLCGLLGVGVGELILPQLLQKKIPVSVAAATSTLVVTLTVASCAEVQVSALINAGGLSAVPWLLVGYMIPGVVIGGQLAAALQGRGLVTQQQLERAIGTLFLIIGIGFGVISFRQSNMM